MMKNSNWIILAFRTSTSQKLIVNEFTSGKNKKGCTICTLKHSFHLFVIVYYKYNLRLYNAVLNSSISYYVSEKEYLASNLV